MLVLVFIAGSVVYAMVLMLLLQVTMTALQLALTLLVFLRCCQYHVACVAATAVAWLQVEEEEEGRMGGREEGRRRSRSRKRKQLVK